MRAKETLRSGATSSRRRPARTADEGFAPALALLVAASGRHPAFAGLLLAAAGLPHVVAGPLAGAALDASRHRRALLRAGPLVLGLCSRRPRWRSARAGRAVRRARRRRRLRRPLLTGGLSAELTQLVPGRPERALALDGATYNVAAIAGPRRRRRGRRARSARRRRCSASRRSRVGGARLVLRLPATPAATASARRLRAGLAGARRLWDARPLRLVTAGTTLAFVGAGALPLLVIARARSSGRRPRAPPARRMAAAALGGSLLLATAARRRPGGAVVARAARRGRSALGALRPGPRAARRPASRSPSSGLADGMLLPAILAVRTAHSRPDERGAVFTTAASAKVAAGACGAAVGGLLIAAAGAAPALLAAAALHVLGALALPAVARGGA